MSKPLTYPDARHWDELFDNAVTYDPSPGVMAPILAEWPCPVHHGRQDPPLQLSSFCAVDGRGDYGCLLVTPRPHVVEWIRDNMLRIGDHLSFRVVCRDDGTALVTVTHSCIIGSRWLALIDASTVPR